MSLDQEQTQVDEPTAEQIEEHEEEKAGVGEGPSVNPPPNPFAAMFARGMRERVLSGERPPELAALNELADRAARSAQSAHDRGERIEFAVGPFEAFCLATACYTAACHPALDHESARSVFDMANTMGRSLAVGLLDHGSDEGVRVLGQMAQAQWDAFDAGGRLEISEPAWSKWRAATDKAAGESAAVDAASSRLASLLEAHRVREAVRGLARVLVDAADTIGGRADELAGLLHPVKSAVRREQDAELAAELVAEQAGALKAFTDVLATASEKDGQSADADADAVRMAVAAESIGVPVDSPSNWFSPPPFVASGTPVADGVSADLGATQAIPVVQERVREAVGMAADPHEAMQQVVVAAAGYQTKLVSGTKLVKVVCRGCWLETWVAFANDADMLVQHGEALAAHLEDSPGCRP